MRMNPVPSATQVASHAQKYFARLHGTTKRKSRFTSLEEKATVTFPVPSLDAFPSLQSLPQPQMCAFPTGALIPISAEQYSSGEHVHRALSDVLDVVSQLCPVPQEHKGV